MKRSKMFLGLTTCCLAIAGVVAAKAHHFGTSPGYYFTALKTKCVAATSTCDYDPSASTICLTVNKKVLEYYTLLTINGKCINPLTYNIH